MKKHITSLFVILSLALIMLSSCASAFELAGEALSEGDYTTAIVKSLEALDEEPGLTAAETLLQDAWTKANNEWMEEINFYEKNSFFDNIAMDLPEWVKVKTDESTSTLDDLEKTIPTYEKLINIHQIIEGKKRFNLNPDSAGLEKRELANKQKIADIYFAMGDNALATEGRDNARNAVDYFNKVNNFITNYPTLSEKYEQAIEKATVQVVLVGNNDTLLARVEDMLNQKTLINVVNVSTKYNSTNSDALNYANQQGADILVYFDADIKGSANVKTDVTPFNSGMTAVKDWGISKTYLLANGVSSIKYSVVDVKNNTVLSEKDYQIENSTDFGVSVTAMIPSSIKSEKVQLGNMTNPKTLKYASLEPGFSDITFTGQLQWYQKIKLGTMDKNFPLYTSMPNFSSDKYSNALSLATETSLASHVFIPFDVIRLPSEDPNYTRYMTTYNAYLGEGISGSIQTSTLDRNVYEALIKQMKTSSFKNNSLKTFLDRDVTSATVKSIYSTILPLLK